jgi:pSer/pThr/pTyr-binding forkhead associated (FHA) protein
MIRLELLADRGNLETREIGISEVEPEIRNSWEFGDDIEGIRIGRHDANQVDLSDYDPERIVSRKHCRIIKVDEGYEVRDGDKRGRLSKNGTYINGGKITNNLLYSGDVIRVGFCEIKVSYS